MTSGPPRLKEALDRGVFAVTVEYNPPKGTNLDKLLASARSLLGRVHAANVTDNTAAEMPAGSLSVCRLLYEMGHEPVMQITCRDRNRVGIHPDLLATTLFAIPDSPVLHGANR